MNAEYVARLTLSVLIFAPGVILLAFCGFVGLLKLVEKTSVFKALVAPDAQPAASGAANPAPGAIVANLVDSVRTEGETEEKRDRASNA